MTDSGAVVESVTAGVLLKQARELAGLHVAALAVSLKVPVSKLEALEADNHAALPDATFVRALASSVCRTLKTDPAPILALLPVAGSPQLNAAPSGLNTPVRMRGARSTSYVGGAIASKSANRSVGVVVVLLLIGALGILYLPGQFVSWLPSLAMQSGGDHSIVSSAVVELKPVLPESIATLNIAPSVSSSPASVLSQTPVIESAPAGGVVSAQAVAPVLDLGGSAVTSEAASADVLLLIARGESWVQVRDAAGGVLLQRNLGAGERVGVTGTLPLSVVVGRADATDIVVRGKPFDIGLFARENVARFEVK